MSSSKNIEYAKTAFLSKTNSAFIEEMHSKFVNNDPSLPQSWKNYFDEIGDEFDPAIHEAMFQIPDPDATPDTIGQLLSCGYKFKDRVLRPAQVGTYK